MITRGSYLPSLPRITFLLLGIAFLGLISCPLQAADNPPPSTPPSAWSKIFGSNSKEAEAEQKQSKTKKQKVERTGHKTAKKGKQSKADTPANNASKDVERSSEPSPESISAPAEKLSEKTNATPDNGTNTSNESIGAFFRGMFGAASSTSPLLDGGGQTDALKSAPSPSNTIPATPTPSVAPQSSLPTLTTPNPETITNPTESISSEPFWKRIFGGASSKPPEAKVEQSVSATQPFSAPTDVSPNPEPTISQNVAPKPNTKEDEPSFWQKLFSSKSSASSKPVTTPTKSAEISPESTATTSVPNSKSENSAIVLPATLTTTSTNTSDSKTNFSLANVCERDKCELMLLYDAPINKANVEKFIQSTTNIPPGTAVLLNSIDGDLNSGIKLGQAFRQKRFNARIGKTKLIKKTLMESEGQCFSACVLAFAGGVSRRIDLNDQIGIYALRSDSKNVNNNEIRSAINGLSSYFDQMGVDRRLVDLMLQVNGSSVSLISLSNAKLLNLDNSSRTNTYPWRMQALDDGLLIALATEKQVSGHFSVTLGLTKQNSQLRLTVYIKPISGSPNLNQLSDYINRNARLQMSFANQTIAPNLMKPWEATSSGIQTAILLSEKEMTIISSSLEFEVELAQINRNPYNLDGITFFGTQGLKGALAAMKK